MLSVLVSGKLVRDPQARMGKGGKPFCTALIVASIEAVTEGDADKVLVSAIAFGKAGEALAALGKGDTVALVGDARLSSWEKDGATNHGLAVTAHRVMSSYQRRKTQRAQTKGQDDGSTVATTFDDAVSF